MSGKGKSDGQGVAKRPRKLGALVVVRPTYPVIPVAAVPTIPTPVATPIVPPPPAPSAYGAPAPAPTPTPTTVAPVPQQAPVPAVPSDRGAASHGVSPTDVWGPDDDELSEDGEDGEDHEDGVHIYILTPLRGL